MVCWLLDSMWISEKGPRDFVDIAFQIKIKDALCITRSFNQACDRTSSRARGRAWLTVMCISEQAETSFPSRCCVLISTLSLDLEALSGCKHRLVTNIAHLCLDGSWLTVVCVTTHCTLAVLQVSVPKKLDFWGLPVFNGDGQMTFRLCA